MAASTTSLGTLRGRCVTGAYNGQYFHGFMGKTRDIVSARGLAPSALFDENGSSKAEVLAMINQYPNLDALQVRGFVPGRYGDTSGFVKRITDGKQEVLITGPDRQIVITDSLKNAVIERILAGDIITDRMFGGMGERLGLPISKFEATPQDLASAFQKYEPDKKLNEKETKELAEQKKEARELGGVLSEYPLGVRHMLAYSFAIAQLAGPYDWHNALQNQTLFVITNPAIDSAIRGIFQDWSFFGLNPSKVFFLASSAYPALVVSENELAEGRGEITHNHGIARLQTTMGDVWTNVDHPGKSIYSYKIMDIYRKAANLQSLNIEDVSYLTHAIDLYAMMIATGMVAEEYADFGMNMDVVGQKPDNPQKGGVLALDPDFDENGQRMTMVESFTAMPRFDHWDSKQAKTRWKEFEWLNLNNNNYPNPAQMMRHLQEVGLPVYLSGKVTGIRNECPQGELAHFLPTLFVARMVRENGVDNPVIIRSVKNLADIPDGLKAMREQDNMPGFLEFAREFEPK